MSDQEGDLLVSVKSKRRSDKKGKNVPLNELGFKPKVYYDCVDGRPKKIFHRFRKYIFFPKSGTIITNLPKIITCLD